MGECETCDREGKFKIISITREENIHGQYYAAALLECEDCEDTRMKTREKEKEELVKSLDKKLALTREGKVKSLYLANPYGFSPQQKRLLLPEIIDTLSNMGYLVKEPFNEVERNIDFEQEDWPYTVAKFNYDTLKSCDGIFAIVNGFPPDEGVMVELGLAIAWDMPTFLFRDDMRTITDNPMYPLNLMLFTGLSPDHWEQFYYSDINELRSPNKALHKFLAKDKRMLAHKPSQNPILVK